MQFRMTASFYLRKMDFKYCLKSLNLVHFQKISDLSSFFHQMLLKFAFEGFDHYSELQVYALNGQVLLSLEYIIDSAVLQAGLYLFHFSQ